MAIPKLAFRNLLGGGTKTWLNALVLSLAFVTIIWGQSLFEGVDKQGSKLLMDMEAGAGQYWASGYDPYDPFTLQDAHRVLSGPVKTLADEGRATPILIVQGTIYPGGRMQSILLKGIDPGQSVLSFPSSSLKAGNHDIPALIGTRMAKSAGLAKGDTVTVRWRDARGAFDAKDLLIVDIFQTEVQVIDLGQVWVPLETLRSMAGMAGQATIVVVAKGFGPAPAADGWTFQGLDVLLSDIKTLVRAKSIGFSIFYTTLMCLAMLALFNTQVLSIWRRRKEIGTLMALGMTRLRVIVLFTLEGTLLSVLAAAVGAVYGIPLLLYMAKYGWTLPSGQADSFNLALSNKIYPSYTIGLIVVTAVIVLITTTVVSYLPARKIAKLKPTDALRGRLS
jgi:putative ABC transport system permease protein